MRARVYAAARVHAQRVERRRARMPQLRGCCQPRRRGATHLCVYGVEPHHVWVRHRLQRARLAQRRRAPGAAAHEHALDRNAAAAGALDGESDLRRDVVVGARDERGCWGRAACCRRRCPTDCVRAPLSPRQRRRCPGRARACSARASLASTRPYLAYCRSRSCLPAWLRDLVGSGLQINTNGRIQHTKAHMDSNIQVVSSAEPLVTKGPRSQSASGSLQRDYRHHIGF